MVPIEIRQSMLEEPSNGSKQTTYLPCKQIAVNVTHSYRVPYLTIHSRHITITNEAIQHSNSQYYCL